MDKKLINWIMFAMTALAATQSSVAAVGTGSPAIGHHRFESCQEAVGGCPMYKDKDPSGSDFLFEEGSGGFRSMEPDKELLSLESELRRRKLLFQPEVQWLVEKAALCSGKNRQWARQQIRLLLESDRIVDMRTGDILRPLAPSQLLSQGEIHLVTQVDGTPFMIPRRALSRGLFVTGPQGGGKSRFLIWLLLKFNAAQPPIHWFVIDPKLELKPWAEPLGALYIDADDPDIGIDLKPPPGGLTYDKWLPSLVPQIGEVIGVVYGTEILQGAATVAVAARENFMRASGKSTEICLQDLFNSIPFVEGISSWRRSQYKDALVTGLSRVLSGSGNLFKCRKGIDLARLFCDHNVIFGTRSITDDFAARFLAVFLLWYLHELDRFSPPSDGPKSALIIDDAHRYVGAREGFDAGRSLSSLGSILTTLRSSGRCFIAVSQVPHLVDSGVLSLMQTVVQIGALHHASDTQLVAKLMGLSEPQRLALSRLKQREVVAMCGSSVWNEVVHGYVENVLDLRGPDHG